MIRYSLRQSLVWELPLTSVRIIGEATNSDGPLVDDFFLCFASDPDGWYEASFYAEGRDAFLVELGHSWGYRPTLELVASTDFASNVLWPEHLIGKPMFKYIALPPTSWFHRLIGLHGNRQEFSDEVLTELRTIV